jgi:hypothetical protein
MDAFNYTRASTDFGIKGVHLITERIR